MVAIATTAGSLARFCFSLNTQLSGKGMLQITVLVFGSLFLPLILSSMGMVSSKHSIREQCAVLVVLLAVVSCTLAFAYDLLGVESPLRSSMVGVGRVSCLRTR